MNPLRALLQRASRSATYPLTIAGVRLIAVVQAIGFPTGQLVPNWLAYALLTYAAICGALAFPPRQTPGSSDEKAAVRPSGYAALVVLDIAAAALVAWKSGLSVLVVLPGLDVAIYGIVGALAIVVVASAAFAAGEAFG